MSYAASFKSLDTYKLSREISLKIYNLSKSFPKEEKFSLTDQIRRSSRSAGAQIAEIWGKRRYEKRFITKLTDADAEQYETQHWLEVAFECQYMDKEQFDELICKCEKLGKIINNMIQKSNKFCQNDKS